jgi:hypothetical protein
MRWQYDRKYRVFGKPPRQRPEMVTLMVAALQRLLRELRMVERFRLRLDSLIAYLASVPTARPIPLSAYQASKGFWRASFMGI